MVELDLPGVGVARAELHGPLLGCGRKRIAFFQQAARLPCGARSAVIQGDIAHDGADLPCDERIMRAPEDDAIDRLVALIKANNDWRDP